MEIERRKTYLIQDPYDDDAVQFIRTIFGYFGLRPVCFYTNPKDRFYGEARYPILKGDKIEARYDVDLGNLDAFVQQVSASYDVLGIIPYREDTVEVAAELCGLFDFGWNDRATLARFRDKNALKTYIREQDSSVRVPACRLVRTEADVHAAPLPSRFVIKPNNGFGNRHIGVFDAASLGGIAAHLAREPGASWVLEEFIDGPEFHVNGQVRSNGEIVVLGILEYRRTVANGHPTVYQAERQCSTRHPLFKTIVEYASRLMRATGLRRCPFHMELKVDELGPCMIDLGARYPSEGGGHMLSRFHPKRPDAYAVAAHDYLGENTFASEPLDWSHYDSHSAVLVYGVSTSAGLIHTLEGIEEVEALPEFVNWPVKPRLGDRIIPTTDLASKSYVVELSHGGGDQRSDELIDLVQRTLRINSTVSPPAWLRAHALNVLQRAPPKLRWLTRGVLSAA